MALADLRLSRQRRQHLPHNKFIRAQKGSIFRPFGFVTCATDPASNAEYPVSTTIEHGETKQRYTIRSKYLLGNDGAMSMVRKAVAGGGEKDGTRTGKIQMLGALAARFGCVADGR